MGIFPLGKITKKLLLLPILFALGKDAKAEDTSTSSGDFLPSLTSPNSLPRLYRIVDRVDDKSKFTTKDAVSYYPVNTEVSFQIIQYKEAGKFGTAYYEKDIDENNPFPEGASPLAIIEPGDSGLAGGFKIYGSLEHNNCSSNTRAGKYCVHYDPSIKSTTFSPLIYIPVHTYVSPKYVQAMNDAIHALPEPILDFLNKQDFKIVIGYDGKDCYWKMWSSFESNDKSLSSTRKYHERIRKGKWKYNGKTIEAVGIFKENKAVIPERYFKFGTEQRVELDAITTKSTLFHEISHKLNRKGPYDNSPLFSDDADFKKAYNDDINKLTVEEEEKLSHLLVNEDEAFATIGGVLLGSYSEERAKFVLSKFPNTAKVVAKVLEEKYNYSTSIPLADYKYQRGGISTTFIHELVRRNINFHLVKRA